MALTNPAVDAPGAVGPYSQAIKFRDLLFVSGNIPLDPATGEIVAGGIEEQTKQALKNLRAVVEASGSDLGKVVKTTARLSGSFRTNYPDPNFPRCFSSR